ncbi:HTH-type transcriptional repressor PurR [Streptomyces tendae]
MTDLTNPFYPHVVAPLHDELGRLGYRMMLLTERSDEAVAQEELLDQSLDGVVLATATTDSRLPARLDRRDMPYVFLNRDTGRAGDYASVVDNEGGGRLVARELAALGHRRIAGIFGAANTTTGRERELGFRLALADEGIGLPEERVVRGPFEYETGYEALSFLLDAAQRPTAVFCGNDVVAVGVLNAARAAGLSVPGDLTVVGFDDLPMASWEVLRLTTVRHDLAELARQAARLLVRRIAGRADPAGSAWLPTEFVPRERTARRREPSPPHGIGRGGRRGRLDADGAPARRLRTVSALAQRAHRDEHGGESERQPQFEPCSGRTAIRTRTPEDEGDGREGQGAPSHPHLGRPAPCAGSRTG